MRQEQTERRATAYSTSSVVSSGSGSSSSDENSLYASWEFEGYFQQFNLLAHFLLSLSEKIERKRKKIQSRLLSLRKVVLILSGNWSSNWSFRKSMKLLCGRTHRIGICSTRLSGQSSFFHLLLPLLFLWDRYALPYLSQAVGLKTPRKIKPMVERRWIFFQVNK